MRKLIIILTVIPIIVVLAGFKAEKKYTVELSLEQWKTVAEVIDNSGSSHQKVKAVQSWIIPQLNNQLDTTKTNK
jgi:hypothetical protein